MRKNPAHFSQPPTPDPVPPDLPGPPAMQRPLEIADPVQDTEQVLLVGCTHDQRGGCRAILLHLGTIFSMIQSPSYKLMQ
jgi:hypothetical protein